MSRSFARAAMVGTLAFGALVASSSSAQAQTGTLNFTGSADLRDPQAGPGGNTLFIDFLVNGTTSGTPSGTITAIETISGTFDPEIMAGTTGSIQDLTITNVGVQGTPLSFVQIGGYTFTLEGAEPGNATGFGPLSLTQVGSTTFGTFNVYGSVTGGDFGTTTGMFTGAFSTQFLNSTVAQVYAMIDAGSVVPVSYSATFDVSRSVVPEPSTYLLMATGLGMIGLVGYRRRGSQS